MAENVSISCLMTNAGKELQAKAHKLGAQVVFDKISVGDGGGDTAPVPTPYGYETALVNEVWRGDIAMKEIDENNAYKLLLHTVIPANDGDFWVRELGVWVQAVNDDGTLDPDTHVLFAYGNHAEYYKTKPVSGQSVTHEIIIPVVISETANVKVIVPDSGYATTSDLNKTKTELTETKTELTETKTELTETKTELTETKTVVSGHTESIEVLETVLARIFDPLGYLRDNTPEVAELGTKVVLPNTVVKLDGTTYANTSMSLDVNDAANWDDETYADRTQRKGTDCYLYACLPSDGTTVPTYKFSVNSTVPDGDDYTEANTRKIGGFHCECADIPSSTTWVVDYKGTKAAHALAGLLAGNILPAGIWDLWHRPKSDYVCGVGMLYVPTYDIWAMCYLPSWDGTQLVSQFGGTVADGASPSVNPIYGNTGLDAETFHILAHQIDMKSISRTEFMAIAEGSNERTNISDSKDWGTTGGHVDTANRRMVSNLGFEDCCGFMWQWTRDYAANGASGWDQTDVYSGNAYDTNGRGSCYGALFGLHCGGGWSDGSSCGSASVASSGVSACRDAYCGGRLVSEPMYGKAM